MKENENKEPSSTAGAAKGGNTSNESVGSAVSTAAGEPVATDDLPTLPEPYGGMLRLAGGIEPVYTADQMREYARAAIAARLAAPTQVSAPQADELSISRQKLNMAKIDVLMDGARARSEEFRDGVTFGANSLHMKMLELAGAPQAKWVILMLRAAIEAHLDPKWACNSDHPALAHALRVTAHVVPEVAPQASAAQEVRAVPEGDRLPKRDVADEIVLLSNVMREHPQLKSVIGREALLMRCVRQALAAPTGTSTAPAAMDEKGGAK